MNIPTKRSIRRMIVPLVVAALLAAMPKGTTAAPKYGTSLDWAPADAAFYSSSMRLKEQWEIVAGSNAWKKIEQLPVVQMVWGMAQFFMYSSGPAAEIRGMLEEPENIELRDLAIDGFSNEVFVYGDKNATRFLETMVKTINSLQFSGMMNDPEDSEASARIVLESLNDQVDQLSAPGLIAGFQLSNTERATSQIQRLKQLAEEWIETEENLKGRLKEAKAGDGEYLVLELDGTLIPWDEVPWEDLEEEPGQYDALKKKLITLKAVVFVGVRDNYLLAGIVPSLDSLSTLGKAKPLSEVAELEPLAKFADRRLTSVNYVSKDFNSTLNNADQQIDDMVNMVRQLLPQAGLDSDTEDRLSDDLGELGKDLKSALPKPGAIMQFSFLMPRGVESYTYDWSENLLLDGSKPLSLLKHAGGNPLLVYVSRSKYSPDQYEMMRKWVKKSYSYFEELAVPHMDWEAQDDYKKFKEIAIPLVERLDKATGEMLMPALADGQTGIVIDAKISSKRWFEGLRQNDQSLPMLEAALIFGVSDAELLKKAMAEYRAIVDEAVAKLKQEDPDALPADFEVPRAETRDVKTADGTGTIYYYTLPEDAGVDAQLTPNAGMSSQVAVLSTAPKQTARLLGDVPLAVSADGPLVDRNKPLAAALHFDWAATVDAMTPWVEFAVRQVMAAMTANDFDEDAEPANDENDPQTRLYLRQARTVLEVLKALRTVESATYREGEAMVTHSFTTIQDVE